MKKKLFFLMLVLMPMSMMATIVVKINGLVYLDDQDGKGPYIWVHGSNSITATDPETGAKITFAKDGFFSDGNLRSHYRKNLDDGNSSTDLIVSKYGGKWYKSRTTSGITDVNCLDDVISINMTGKTSNISNYKGIEYFSELQSLTLNSNGAQVSSVSLDLSHNTKLTTLNWNGAKFGSGNLNISNTQLISLNVSLLKNINSLNVSNTGITNLDISQLGGLVSLTATDLTLNSLTLPTTKTKLVSIVLDRTTISSLDLSDYSYVDYISLNGCTSLTSLTLPSETALLRYLDISNTENSLSDNYTSSNPLDLTQYTRLHSGVQGNGVKYENTGFVRDSNLLINMPNMEEIVLDLDDPECDSLTRTPDFSQHTNLKYLKLSGADGLILPPGRTDFVLDLTGSPNITHVDMSNQTDLIDLDVINVRSLDVSGCSALHDLTVRGDSAQAVTLSTGNEALKILNISYSGISKIDLSGGIAPNLEDFKAWYSAIEELNLSGHTALKKLNLLPPNDGSSEGLMTYGIDEWRKSNKLRDINISGCSGLTGYLTLNYDNLEYWVPLERLDASGCTGITQFECPNSLLSYLNFDDCTNLKYITMNQGRLTGEGDFHMANCRKLATFIAHRHRWKTMDFLLTPINGRTQEDINALTQLQVNGGSYTILENGERKIREYNGKEMRTTNRLRTLDLRYVKNGTFKKLLCEDNLIDSIDFTHVGSGLEKLMISNNMLLTLDLSTLNPNLLEQPGNESGWENQVAFLDVEVVKGNYNVPNDNGSKDWVALHMPQSGYTHRMDNTLGLYPNLYCETIDSARIADEAYPWMCKVEETDSLAGVDGGSGFAYANFDPNHTGEHIFLHSQNEMGYKDQDLYGKLLKYQYNTGYNRTKDAQGKPTSTKIKEDSKYDPHINVRVHVWPFIMNLNPSTKSPESLAVSSELDYYSNTLYLDYDAVIPKGVEVYFVSGMKDKKNVTVADNNGTVESQFTLELFGKGDVDLSDPELDLTKPENNVILPAYTPVVVKAKRAAGLYAFQTAWDFKEIEGWQNIRHITGYPDEPHILVGVQKTDARITRPEYVASLAAAQQLKAEMNNMLTGVGGEKSTQVKMEEPDFNIYLRSDSTPGRKTVLVLGLESKSKVIGFWPYSGKKPINAHRCVITESDFKHNGGNAKSFNGASFYLSDDDETTGIEHINDSSNQVSGAWYTLQGVRLNSRPTKQGIYIHAGKKIVIK